MTISDTIIVALVAAISSILTTSAAAWFTRKKTKADAADVTVDTSLKIVTALERRVERLEARTVKQEAMIEKMEGQIELQEETIKYLFDGVAILIEQIEALGHKPKFVPKPIFRGSSGDEFDFGVKKRE